jgi:hypothetical protein
MGTERTREPDREVLEDWVAKSEGVVRSVKERAMRRAVLGEMVESQTANSLVVGLHQLVARSRAGQVHARSVLRELALEPVAFERVSYIVRERGYRIAIDKDWPDVARMLLTTTIENANPTLDEARTDNDYASESVGERCAAARRKDRNKLDRLLHDRDYRVIRILLDNPRLIERDVIKICAMRPTRPEVLQEVARHRRWSSRYSVRKALACNPHTPTPIARRLVATLMQQDLRAVLGAATVPTEIRDSARELLAALRTE